MTERPNDELRREIADALAVAAPERRVDAILAIVLHYGEHRGATALRAAAADMTKAADIIDRTWGT